MNARFIGADVETYRLQVEEARDLYSEQCKRSMMLEDALTEMQDALEAARAEAYAVKEQLADSDTRVIGKLFQRQSLFVELDLPMY